MRDFTIGGVVRQTLELLGRHAGSLLILALLFVALPKVIGYVAFAQIEQGGSPVWAFLPWALDLVGGMFLQIILIRIVIGAAQDRAPAIGGSLGPAARLFFPTLWINFLSGMGIGLAAILLVFPAFMLACRWAVVIPVAVVERSGVSESFRRSSTLTKGVRWRIFGLVLMVGLVVGLSGGVVLLAQRLLAVPGHSSWTILILDVLSSSFDGVVIGVAIASIYLDLRRSKEGFLSQDLVAVFD